MMRHNCCEDHYSKDVYLIILHYWKDVNNMNKDYEYYYVESPKLQDWLEG
jgi:hypothetical protein